MSRPRMTSFAMRRPLLILVAAFALLASALGAQAAAAAPEPPKTGCPAVTSGWERQTVAAAAENFFEHLLPGQFADVDDFAQAIAGWDVNADGLVCIKLSWGFDLNPKSHWYSLGLNTLGEPVHAMQVMDNRSAAA